MVVPWWIALLLSVVLLGTASIGIIINDNTRDLVEEVDEKAKVDIKNISCFQRDIAAIVEICENAGVKEELKNLSELFRFSDPVTNDATREIEETIRTMLSELKEVVGDGSIDDVYALIKKITNTLNERNRVCKVSKV